MATTFNTPLRWLTTREVRASDLKSGATIAIGFLSFFAKSITRSKSCYVSTTMSVRKIYIPASIFAFTIVAPYLLDDFYISFRPYYMFKLVEAFFSPP